MEKFKRSLMWYFYSPCKKVKGKERRFV